MSALRVGLFIAAFLSLPLASCKRGPVDTTKHYYDDDEAPEYQIQIVNGEEKKVPWAEVPEAQRGRARCLQLESTTAASASSS